MEKKIAAKQEQIDKLRLKIERDEEKIKKLEEDIEQIKITEIKGTIKEIDMPLAEALKILRESKSRL